MLFSFDPYPLSTTGHTKLKYKAQLQAHLQLHLHPRHTHLNELAVHGLEQPPVDLLDSVILLAQNNASLVCKCDDEGCGKSDLSVVLAHKVLCKLVQHHPAKKQATEDICYSRAHKVTKTGSNLESQCVFVLYATYSCMQEQQLPYMQGYCSC